jgi:hypothetical protein
MNAYLEGGEAVSRIVLRDFIHAAVADLKKPGNTV